MLASMIDGWHLVWVGFSFADQRINGVLLEVAEPDLVRMAELVRKYADLSLGTTDSAVIAVAERHENYDITTLDRRHFSVV